MEVFGASLSQAAWYRFPFLEMLTMYFQTLAKEIVIVQVSPCFRSLWRYHTRTHP